jgi:murein DD-endopeptidase MepM/ murein hydrolase activator NlpD
MRRLLFLACTSALLAAPGPAFASDSTSAVAPATGGAVAPSSSGGTSYGTPLRKVRRVRRVPSRPVASEFRVTPGVLEAGRRSTFTFRVEGHARVVRIRIELTRAGARGPAKLLRLGYRHTRRRLRHFWTPAPGELAAGEYTASLQAFDDDGHELRRTAAASGRDHISVRVPPPPATAPAAGVFPIQGDYSFGGEDARFGAGREGHVHQGQDITAARGTPLVAPLAATVSWVDFQAYGAGRYVVMRGADGRDYVFMHLKRASVTVSAGGTLAAGEQFAQVGSTGAASGPHLHFEIWPDGWYSSTASQPIDPLPQLQAWAVSR